MEVLLVFLSALLGTQCTENNGGKICVTKFNKTHNKTKSVREASRAERSVGESEHSSPCIRCDVVSQWLAEYDEYEPHLYL